LARPWIFFASGEAWWIGLSWPFSLMVEIAREVVQALIPLILGLAVYLILVRRCSIRGFTSGAAVLTGSLIAINVAMTFLRGNQYRLVWFVPTLLYMAAMLAGIWTGRRRRALRSPVPY
jgi:hypothetical protein